jgi:hypothetical protein
LKKSLKKIEGPDDLTWNDPDGCSGMWPVLGYTITLAELYRPTHLLLIIPTLKDI